jgi:hypothetical protein
MSEVTVGAMTDYMERAEHVSLEQHMEFIDALMMGRVATARRMYNDAKARENEA